MQAVLQRSYTAFAVRLLGENYAPSANGRLLRASHKIVPANDSDEGDICIELRIRRYGDGAMSKMLERIAKVKEWCMTRSSVFYNSADTLVHRAYVYIFDKSL